MDYPALDYPTPYVVIDLPTVRNNLERLAAMARERGLRVRPHAKTHKLLPIARMQQESGAQGLTVATLKEAEVFAAGGFKDLFIAFPLWPTEQVRGRIEALIADGCAVRVGVDSTEAAAGWSGVEGLELMIELDSGHHRSGTLPDKTPAIAHVAQVGGLKVAGVFTFPGHSYAPGAAADASASEVSVLQSARHHLSEAGFDDLIISGGSTPSAFESSAEMDEIRPGVYPFYDAQQLGLERCTEDDIALTMVATVVSKRDDLGTFILDAGSKNLGSDKPAWLDGLGRIKGHPSARIIALSEHHATVNWDEELPVLGSRLEIIPNHVCLIPPLADEVVAVDGDEHVVWPVDA